MRPTNTASNNTAIMKLIVMPVRCRRNASPCIGMSDSGTLKKISVPYTAAASAVTTAVVLPDNAAADSATGTSSNVMNGLLAPPVK